MKELYYNFRTNIKQQGLDSQVPQKIEYCFGLIGDQRRMHVLKGRIFRALGNVENILVRLGSTGGLPYFVMCVESTTSPNLLLEQLPFDSKSMGIDPRLYRRKRKGMDGLENYFAAIVSRYVLKQRKRSGK